MKSQDSQDGDLPIEILQLFQSFAKDLHDLTLPFFVVFVLLIFFLFSSAIPTHYRDIQYRFPVIIVDYNISVHFNFKILFHVFVINPLLHE